MDWFLLIGMVLTTVLGFFFCVIIIWQKTSWWAKLIAPVMLFGMVGASYFSVNMLLSNPLKMKMSFTESRAQVLDYFLIENDALYIWVLHEDEIKPRYYYLPWDAETISNFIEQWREAEENGVPLLLEPSLLDKKYTKPFYKAPQPMLPNKGQEGRPQQDRNI